MPYTGKRKRVYYVACMGKGREYVYYRIWEGVEVHHIANARKDKGIHHILNVRKQKGIIHIPYTKKRKGMYHTAYMRKGK